MYKITTIFVWGNSALNSRLYSLNRVLVKIIGPGSWDHKDLAGHKDSPERWNRVENWGDRCLSYPESWNSGKEGKDHFNSVSLGVPEVSLFNGEFWTFCKVFPPICFKKYQNHFLKGRGSFRGAFGLNRGFCDAYTGYLAWVKVKGCMGQGHLSVCCLNIIV